MKIYFYVFGNSLRSHHRWEINIYSSAHILDIFRVHCLDGARSVAMALREFFTWPAKDILPPIKEGERTEWIVIPTRSRLISSAKSIFFQLDRSKLAVRTVWALEALIISNYADVLSYAEHIESCRQHVYLNCCDSDFQLAPCSLGRSRRHAEEIGS